MKYLFVADERITNHFLRKMVKKISIDELSVIEAKDKNIADAQRFHRLRLCLQAWLY